MATYNSAQAGDFSADATWTEAGHPNANDDVANIAHAVDYNIGESAITWGNITLNSGGTLEFPTTASSDLIFNTTGILTINSGGKLACGSVGTPLGTAYTLNIHWPQGAATRNTLVLNDGGEIAVFGNPDFYGSEKYADLDSDWTTGQTLYIAGDFSSTWQADQKFWIHRNYQYSGYLTDADIFTIASVGTYDSGNDRTPITISEEAPGVTYAAVYEGFQSQLIMVSRNVELADPGSSWDVGGYNTYTENIRFNNNQAGGNNLIDIRDAIFRGWERGVYGGYNFVGTNIIFLNNNFGFYTSHIIKGSMDFISTRTALRGTNNFDIVGNITNSWDAFYIDYGNKIEGNIIGCNAGLRGYAVKMEGNIVSCSRCVTEAYDGTMVGDIIGSTYGIASTKGFSLIGGIKDCSIVAADSPVKVRVNGDLSGNSNDLIIVETTRKRSFVLEGSTLEGANRQPVRIYQNAGNWLPAVSGDAHFQTPPSGNSWVLEAIPNSYCDDSYCNQLELSPLNEMALDTVSGSQTLTFKIYPVGWTTALNQNDVVLEVRYLDSASGITRTTIVNSTATYANGAWRDLSVTFNPLQSGIVYFQVYFRTYESGCYMLIDPEPVIS